MMFSSSELLFDPHRKEWKTKKGLIKKGKGSMKKAAELQKKERSTK